MTLGQLLCGSNGAPRKTGGEKRWILKGEHVADHVGLHHADFDWHLHSLAYMNIWAGRRTKGNVDPVYDTQVQEIHTLKHKYRSTQVLYCDVWIPAVCVTVAVNMALASAARSWTLQHILMHGQNWEGDKIHTQETAVRENPLNSTTHHSYFIYLGLYEHTTEVDMALKLIFPSIEKR